MSFDITKAPPGATHWAPETEAWLESWYRFEDGLWYQVNDYWASDIIERPYGLPAQAWYKSGKESLLRPLEDLVESNHGHTS